MNHQDVVLRTCFALGSTLWIAGFIAAAVRRKLSYATISLCLTLPITIAGINISAGLMTATLLWVLIRGEKGPLRAALIPANYALWAYFGAAIIVSVMAVDSSRCWGDLQRDLHKLWVFSLFLVALTAEPAPKSHLALAAAFLFAAGVGIFQALTQRVGEGVPWEVMTRMRAHAFVHPVTFGQQMTLAILGSLCFLGYPPPGSSRKLNLAACLSFLAVVITALILSQGRGAFVALAAGFAAICVIDRRFRKYGYLAMAAGAAGVVLLEVIPESSRSISRTLFRDGFSSGDNNLNPQFHRLILWRVGLDMFKDYPLLGIGLGNYKTQFVSYFQGKVDGQWVWHSAHNIYIHQLAERGLVGLGALLSFLGILTVRAYRRAKQSPTGPNLWAWSVMAAFLVMNLTESTFQVEMMATTVLFIWAWAEANHSRPAPSAKLPLS
ncbi:MAG: O-antigen ligase family protein [Elusimicrobia bacterium]|nr:O-antigen ligase family protein [Elusimicrobiota bacterium]